MDAYSDPQAVARYVMTQQFKLTYGLSTGQWRKMQIGEQAA